MVERPRRTLTLTGAEVLWLSDNVRLASADKVGEDRKDAYTALARDALLLIGSAFVEVVSSKTPYLTIVKLSLDEETCWLLRESVRTDSTYAETILGPDLLRKVYEALSSFHADVDIDTVDEDELPADYAERLAAYKESVKAPSAREIADLQEGSYGG